MKLHALLFLLTGLAANVLAAAPQPPADARQFLPAHAVRRFGEAGFRQEGEATSITFSRVGGRMLSVDGHRDCVRLWDSLGRQSVGFGTGILAACFVEPGKAVRTVDGTGRLQSWDAQTGQQAGESIAGLPSVKAGAFSPDGRFALLVGERHLEVWDCEDRRRIVAREGFPSIASVAISPTGKWAAVGGQDGRVWLVNVASGEVACERNSRVRWVRGLRFSSDGKVLAGVAQGCVSVWETGTWKELWSGDSVEAVPAFSSDSSQIAIVSRGVVVLRQARTGRVIQRFQAEGCEDATDAAFSPDGARIAIASLGHRIRVFDLTNGVGQGSHGHRGPVRSVHFVAGTLVCAGSLDRRLSVWDTASGFRLSLSFGSGETASSTGGVTLNKGVTSELVVGDARSALAVRRIAGGTGRAHALAVSPGGHYLGAAYRDGALIWSARSGRELLRVGGADPLTALALAETDGGLLLGGSLRGRIGLWSLKTGKSLWNTSLPGLVWSSYYLAGGKEVGCVVVVPVSPVEQHDGPTYFRLDRSTGKILSRTHLSRELTPPVALSTDGGLIAVGERDTIRVMNPATGLELFRLQAPSRISSLTFSSDASRLASGHADTTVLLWDCEEARLDAVWAAMGDSSPKVASEAATAMTRRPGATAFLSRRLFAEGLIEHVVWECLRDCDSDNYHVRERGSARLRGLGLDALFALSHAAEKVVSPEARKRCRAALSRLQEMPPSTPMKRDPLKKLVPSPLFREEAIKVRMLHATAALAELNQTQGRACLRQLADGPPEGWFTGRAKELLRPPPAKVE